MARTLTSDDKLDWLQLCRSGGVGPRTFFKLLERFGSARQAYRELPRLASAAGDPERWRPCRREEAQVELAALEALGAQLIARCEPDFPPLLGEIADPPPLLTVRGRIDLLHAPCVALVGARNASANGRVFARHLARELAEAGLTVVSGLARGIDTAAHEGALEAGGATVAVLASGVDVAYPEENANLMARIAAAGALVSERPPGSEPQARHFPRRNRLIAGLSYGVVVVEAAPQSGSLITARLAAEYGREVMAVPGSPLDPRHRGTNMLLREGATLVESADDVRAALAPQLARAGAQPSRQARVGRPTRSVAPGPGTRSTGSSKPRPAAPAARSEPRADDLVGRIFEHLGPEPLLVDELIRQCRAGTAEIQHALLELELDGRIERHPGGRVSLASS